MKFFESQDKSDQIVRLFKNSRAGFDFDKKAIKNRLLSNIEEQQMSMATDRIQQLSRKPFLSRHRLATALGVAILAAVGSGAALSRANFSSPGDALHAVDQFQEQLLLKLPLPAGQRAAIQARMVEERNRELEQIAELNDVNNVKVQAVDESQSVLNQAVEQARNKRDSYVKDGKKDGEEKFNKVLNRLEALAADQERQVEKLRELEKDELVREKLDSQLEAIKDLRERARIDVETQK